MPRELKSTDMPACHCLNCGKLIDAAANFEDQKPSSGDITICIGCGHIMAFADDLTVRALTDKEMHDVAGDERLLQLQQCLAWVKQQPKRAK